MKSVRKSKKKCFVIMPFKRLYKGRYERIYGPAIEAAELFPHLAGGAGVSTITEDIEKGIRNSHICFADISEDNPNVWYELGFAYACSKQVVMVCDRKKRPEKKLPFDISVKKVIFYPDVQSATNREQFQQDIIDDLMEKAAVAPINVVAPVAGGDAVASSQSQGSAGEQLPEGWDAMDRKVFKAIVDYYDRNGRPLREKRDGFSMALLDVSRNSARVMHSADKLMQKGFIKRVHFHKEPLGIYDGDVERYDGYIPTQAGMDFSQKEENLHLLD